MEGFRTIDYDPDRRGIFYTYMGREYGPFNSYASAYADLDFREHNPPILTEDEERELISKIVAWARLNSIKIGG